jgi:hypothetical protein
VSTGLDALAGEGRRAAAVIVTAPCPDHVPPLALQAKRSKENPLGYFDDELTKQILDLKEGFDIAQNYDPALPPIPGLNTPNRWPEGEVGATGMPRVFRHQGQP